MNCKRCNSKRVLSLMSHASDRHVAELNGKEKIGYAPEIQGICGGDDTNLDICLDCGQVQGIFPKSKVEELEDESEN